MVFWFLGPKIVLLWHLDVLIFSLDDLWYLPRDSFVTSKLKLESVWQLSNSKLAIYNIKLLKGRKSLNKNSLCGSHCIYKTSGGIFPYNRFINIIYQATVFIETEITYINVLHCYSSLKWYNGIYLHRFLFSPSTKLWEVISLMIV